MTNATDNRTTELREKLDERGIVWMDVYRPTIFRTCWKTGDADVYCYFDEDKSTGLFELHISGYDFTPEQAIAAALGRPNATSSQESIVRSFLRKISPNRDWDYLGEHEHAMIADLVDAIAATLGSGTLTAEQVREAVMSADRWEKPMGNTGLTNTHLIIRDDGWQAIADELNAAIGGGTCCIVKTPSDSDFSNDWRYRCSECGCSIPVNERDPDTGDVINAANYCPNCGARVEVDA